MTPTASFHVSNSLHEIRYLPLTVLTISADDSNREYLKCVLRHSNWRLQFVNTFDQACAHLNAEQVAVILLDVSCAHLCTDLLRIIRAMPVSPELVMLVPADREDDMHLLLRQGVHGVFGPDFRPEEIRSMVGQAGRCWNDKLVFELAPKRATLAAYRR